jgi:DNA-binding MarR family transcriptional regulator
MRWCEVCFRGVAMYSHAFQLKMGHLRQLALGRGAIRDKRIKLMTPARFDLLYALRRLHRPDSEGGRLPPMAVGLRQTDLRKKLGVVRQVTSRMLIQLEAWGWIQREVCEDDRRRKYVRITKKGLRALGKVMRRIVRHRIFEKAWDGFAHACTATTNQKRLNRERYKSWDWLEGLARHFGAGSTLQHDFGLVPPE